jgi:hypothetical protein
MAHKEWPTRLNLHESNHTVADFSLASSNVVANTCLNEQLQLRVEKQIYPAVNGPKSIELCINSANEAAITAIAADPTAEIECRHES